MALSSVLHALESPVASREFGLARAVAQNLYVLCNSRLGTSPSSPFAGIPDPATAIRAQPAGAHLLKRAVLAAIETCEPRIQRPRVDIIDSPAGEGVTLSVRGILPDAHPVKCAVRFDPDGAAQVHLLPELRPGFTHEESVDG